MTSGLKEHEKFWAFLFLVCAILALVLLASTFDRGAQNDIVAQGKLRIIDNSITGLLTLAGMCAQALFRISTGTPEKVEVTNTPLNPVPTDPKVDTEVDTDELPEAEKL